MKLQNIDYQGTLHGQRPIIEIDQHALRTVVEKICTQCRYPLLALRLLLHVITGIDADGHIQLSARHLAKRLDVNYDTVTKCLKQLRAMEVLEIDQNSRS